MLILWTRNGQSGSSVKSRRLKKGRKLVVEVQRQESTKSKDNVSTVSNEMPNCRKLLRKLGHVCPLIKDQRFAEDAVLYGVRFKVPGKCEGYVCRALSTFDRLYPTCRHDRLMMKILIVLHLSTQERVQCRNIKDTKADTQKWQSQLAQEMVPCLGADYLFECQIFGSMDLETDLAGIVLTSHDVVKYKVPMAGVPSRTDVEGIRTWAASKNIPVLEFEYVLHRQTRTSFTKGKYAPLTAGKKAPKRVTLLGKSPNS